MKITIEHYDIKASIETEREDLTCDECLEVIINLMKAIGYNDVNIHNSIIELAYELKQI